VVRQAESNYGDGPVVTIGIITWQSRELLSGLLESLRDNAPRVSSEIIVVDNASTDGAIEMIESDFPKVRVIRNRENLGVAPARNTIFREAQGSYIVLLDVDTTVTVGAIDTLVGVMEEHPEAAIGGPKLVYEDGSLQHSCRPFPKLIYIAMEGTFLKDWFPRNRFMREYTMADWAHDEIKKVDWMYGACLIIRKNSLEKIGLFDEKFFYLYEDVDLCFRARKLGFDVLYIPLATVVHFLRREQKGVFHPRVGTHIKSITRYMLKNRYAIIR
jgi:GT2 family glycosyltransferase